MSCDVGKAAKELKNELWRRWSDVRIGEWGSTSQLILQPFRCFSYVIGTSPTSPGEPPMPLWCLICSYSVGPNLLWLRPAGLYERYKLALELKRLKTPVLGHKAFVSLSTTRSYSFKNNLKSENGKKKETKKLSLIIDFWKVDSNRMYKQTSNVSDTRRDISESGPVNKPKISFIFFLEARHIHILYSMFCSS